MKHSVLLKNNWFHDTPIVIGGITYCTVGKLLLCKRIMLFPIVLLFLFKFRSAYANSSMFKSTSIQRQNLSIPISHQLTAKTTIECGIRSSSLKVNNCWIWTLYLIESRGDCKRPCCDQLNAYILERLLFCWRYKMCVFSWSQHGRLQSFLGLNMI